MIDVRLLHHLEKLPRIGGERFHIAALALGIDGVERERRLARARQAGEHHELVARDREVDVLEIVLARAAHRDGSPVEQLGQWIGGCGGDPFGGLGSSGFRSAWHAGRSSDGRGHTSTGLYGWPPRFRETAPGVPR